MEYPPFFLHYYSVMATTKTKKDLFQFNDCLAFWGQGEVKSPVLSASIPGPVGPIDLGVDRAIRITHAENSITSIRQDRGQRVSSSPPWAVEHLGLEFAEFVLQVGELIRKGLNDGWVPCAKSCVFRGPQILGSLQGAHIIGPESGLLGEGDILGVHVERHRSFSMSW